MKNDEISLWDQEMMETKNNEKTYKASFESSEVEILANKKNLPAKQALETNRIYNGK